MPFLILIAGAAVAIYFFVIRARNVGNAAGELFDVANDVRLAARRFGFTRRTNVHPVESIDDPKVATAAIAQAFLELEDLPTQDQRNAMLVAIQSELELDQGDAEELVVLGRWLTAQCGSAEAAISRLSRKLYKLDGSSSFQPMMVLIKATVAAGGDLNAHQQEALEDIKRAFRIR